MEHHTMRGGMDLMAGDERYYAVSLSSPPSQRHEASLGHQQLIGHVAGDADRFRDERATDFDDFDEGRPTMMRGSSARGKLPSSSSALQGRFSGRLEMKEDERLLADECSRLGPILGLGHHMTLAKLARLICRGEVRAVVERMRLDQQDSDARLYTASYLLQSILNDPEAPAPIRDRVAAFLTSQDQQVPLETTQFQQRDERVMRKRPHEAGPHLSSRSMPPPSEREGNGLSMGLGGREVRWRAGEGSVSQASSASLPSSLHSRYTTQGGLGSYQMPQAPMLHDYLPRAQPQLQPQSQSLHTLLLQQQQQQQQQQGLLAPGSYPQSHLQHPGLVLGDLPLLQAQMSNHQSLQLIAQQPLQPSSQQPYLQHQQHQQLTRGLMIPDNSTHSIMTLNTSQQLQHPQQQQQQQHVSSLQYQQPQHVLDLSTSAGQPSSSHLPPGQ
jgi:hypothetical protein